MDTDLPHCSGAPATVQRRQKKIFTIRRFDESPAISAPNVLDRPLSRGGSDGDSVDVCRLKRWRILDDADRLED